jgi:hypothetical protein
MTTDGPAGRPRRRRHAAARGRVVVAGVSAGAAALLVGLMGHPAADAGARPVDHPVPLVRPSDAPPVTSSHAS